MNHTHLDLLLSVPRLDSCLVSPDGAWIAWNWSAGSGPANVFAAPLSGTPAPVQLSDAPERTTVRAWTADSRAVIVAQDHGGDERVQLFRIDLGAPGILTALNEPSPPYFLRGGNLHPNEKWLVYAANFDFGHGELLEASWVYRQDMANGERIVLARPQLPAYVWPQLNDAGTHVLYSRSDLDPAGIQVWLVDIEGQHDREILNAGAGAKVTATWFPDGRRVLFLAENGPYRRLGTLDITNDERRWLIDDPQRDLEVAWVPRGVQEELVVVVETRDARSHAALLDLTLGVETAVRCDATECVPLAATADRGWIALVSGSRQPDDLVCYELTDMPAVSGRSLTGLWDTTALRPEDLTAAEDFRWNSVDGSVIQGWLYRPAGGARGTIVHVHGGPTAHSRDAYDPKIQYLVSCGFIVLAPNYRGSTGFGLAFEDSVKEDGWGGREQDDIRTGIQALLQRGIAEPGKVGITGTSYGGYSSWWAITHWPVEVVAAAAPICGMTDLVVDYQTTRPDLRPYSEEMMGGSPEQIPEKYRARSPIHFVREIRGSLLIVQGLRDPNVTPDNLAVVCAALDAASIPYRVLTFEDEGHGIKKPENLRTLYTTLVSFFEAAFSSEGQVLQPCVDV